MTSSVDLIVTGGRIFTGGVDGEWASALAVSGGKIVAVGNDARILSMAEEQTPTLDLGGKLVLPALIDVHAHLAMGGHQLAFELRFAPDSSVEDILAMVAEHASTIAPDEWVVGGIVGSSVMNHVAGGNGMREALDKAAAGRPVMLRDDSHHNRWVNSRALELMGVDESSSDPEGGKLVRDAAGVLTSVLWEAACPIAEDAASASISDHDARERTALKAAISMMTSFGIVTIQEALASEREIRQLCRLDQENELDARVVWSLPARTGMVTGTVGEELYAIAQEVARVRTRPGFIKIFLDGVPMTRTSALLEPYKCHAGEDPEDRGPLYWSDDELVAELERCYSLAWGAKLHATGDRSVRQALDAIEKVRKSHGPGPIFQIAHVAYISADDIKRFSELGVVADASPYIWFPTPFDESISSQIPDSLVEHDWPLRDLIESGATVAGGSDWPVVPLPNPWLAIQTLVTRSSLDPSDPTVKNAAQRIDVRSALDAFTAGSARAVGAADTTGRLSDGLSADFIVVDRNIFEIEATEIAGTQVLATYFEGRRVHEHPDTDL